ncbi:hypothetical protein BHM03_00012232 [Ensete ventricosum]|nr:hypothetical protein BHM03_00012232 [Ensete ventricosum]
MRRGLPRTGTPGGAGGVGEFVLKTLFYVEYQDIGSDIETDGQVNRQGTICVLLAVRRDGNSLSDRQGTSAGRDVLFLSENRDHSFPEEELTSGGSGYSSCSRSDAMGTR